jgi:hypothetical protein
MPVACRTVSACLALMRAASGNPEMFQWIGQGLDFCLVVPFFEST